MAERFPRQVIRALEGTAFPLRMLTGVRELRAYLDRVETDALLRAREMGASPRDIADALGVTRQGVYHKLQRLSSGGSRVEGTEPPGAIVVPDLEHDAER